MVGMGLTKISDVTPEACAVFMADLAADAARILNENGQAEHEDADDLEYYATDKAGNVSNERSGEDGVATNTRQRRPIGSSFAFVSDALSVVSFLYLQRDVFKEVGIEPPAEPPLGERSVSAAAMEIVEQAEVQVRPVPKEIAVKILSEAVDFLREPAEDIIRLQNLYLDARGSSLKDDMLASKKSRTAAQAALRDFDFSPRAGTTAPWRERLSDEEERYGGKGRGRVLLRAAPVHILPQLIDDVIGAASTVVQGMSGLRSSEVLGIEVDPRHTGPWPSYLDVRVSATGINELFYLKSKLFKSTEGFRETEWLIGSRTLGSDVVPPIVQALQVVERLLSPYRSNCSRLFLIYKTSRGLFAQGETVQGLTNVMLSKAQRVFIAMYVKVDWTALPDTPPYRLLRTHGPWGIRSHQWRSTFAQFLYATDATSLALLSDHFKHMSSAMTEQRYVGGNPSFLPYFQQARYTMTVNTLREIASGTRPAAGGFAKLVREHAASLISVDAGTDQPGIGDRLDRLLLDHDLRLWFFEHGKCGGAFRPRDALCHEEAGTSSGSGRGRDWEPNWSHRRLSTCIRCSNWMVDPEHESFWRRTLSEASEMRDVHLGISPSGLIEQLDGKIRQAKGFLQGFETRGRGQGREDDT